jgi:hypothetical protein
MHVPFIFHRPGMLRRLPKPRLPRRCIRFFATHGARDDVLFIIIALLRIALPHGEDNNLIEHHVTAMSMTTSPNCGRLVVVSNAHSRYEIYHAVVSVVLRCFAVGDSHGPCPIEVA